MKFSIKMLIPFQNITSKYNIDNTKIILHIGAHICEERNAYLNFGFTDDRIIWIDGNPDLISKMKNEIPTLRIYKGLISNEDYKEVDFIITNNIQSSSILELDEHLKEHPEIHEISRHKDTTITIDTLLKNNNIDTQDIHFVNIDIQGAELLALEGMLTVLPHVKYIYLEVNIKHLYKNCALIGDIDKFLEKHGFKISEKYITCWGWGDALYVKI